MSYYVSPSGNDSNPGTEAQPFATLSHAQSVVRSSGDKTVIVRGGTFTLGANWNFNSSDNGETWIPYTGEIPIIDGASNYGLVLDNVSNWTMNGFTFNHLGLASHPFSSSEQSPIIMGFCSNITMRWNEITNVQESAIRGFNSSNLDISDNTIDGVNNPTGATVFGTGAIGFRTSASNSTFNHNLIRNTTGMGIALDGGPSAQYSSNNLSVDRNLLIDTNTASYDSGAIYFYDDGKLSTGLRVTNNYVLRTGNDPSSDNIHALYADDGASNTYWAGNIVVSKGQWGMVIHGGSNNLFENNLFDLSAGNILGLYQTSSISPGGSMAGNEFRKNIVFSSGNFGNPMWNNYTDHGEAAPNIHDNLYYSGSGASIPNVDYADSHRILANPQFTNPTGNDYSMPGTSPFFTTIGGVAFATDQGPRPNPYALAGLSVIHSFTGPASIDFGATATLNWSVGAADSISIAPGPGDVTGKTSIDVTINADTAFILTAQNAIGKVTATFTVRLTSSPGTGSGAPVQAANAGFNTLDFADDFATVDASAWFPGIYYEPAYGAGQSITASSSVLDLNITPTRWNSGGNYSDTSLLTISHDFSTVRAWKYGYFEARMKWDTVTGAWPAFWLNGDYGTSSPWMELDVFEGQGNDSGAFFGTLHAWPRNWQSSPNRFPVSGVDFSQWHTYGALWTPGQVQWFLDDQLIATMSGSEYPAEGDSGPALYMILSMQMGNDWSEGNTSGVTASEMNNYVDWVKVWKFGTDPGTGGTGTGGTGTGTGTGGTGSGTGTLSAAPEIGSFTSTATTLTVGASATLNWVVTNATATYLNGILQTGGSATVSPKTTTTYELTVVNGLTNNTQSITITVLGEAPENIEYHQIREGDRHGKGTAFQMSDRTGTLGDLGGFLVDGTPTRVKVDGSMLSVDSSGTLHLNPGALLSGYLYGQVPRGTVNGANRFFRLDYAPASDYMWLVVNGDEQKPPIDGLAALASPDYTINDATATITYAIAPRSTDWHYVKYFRKNAAPAAPTITAATLYLTSAHTPSSSGSGCDFGGMASFSTITTITPVPDWFHSTSAWTKRTDSVDLTVGNGQLPKFIDGTINLIVGLEQDGLDTGDFSPAEEYWIYDCYIVATYSDASTHIWRPTAYSQGILTASSVGSITNPENAIDAFDTTYAVLSCTHFMGGGLDGVYLNLNTFTQYT